MKLHSVLVRQTRHLFHGKPSFEKKPALAKDGWEPAASAETLPVPDMKWNNQGVSGWRMAGRSDWLAE